MSKSTDDASGFFTSAGDPNFPQNSLDPGAERGPSSFDTRHRLSAAYVKELPFGPDQALGNLGLLSRALANTDFELVATLQSGRPFTVALLPDRVAAARILLSSQAVTRWIEADVGAGVDSGTCAFVDADFESEWAPDEDESEPLLDAMELESSSLGPSANAVHRKLGTRDVFAFSSGLGDGIYSAYWGLDETGAPAVFCLDFDLLVCPVTIDVPSGRFAGMAVVFEAKDSASEKLRYVYRLLVHDGVIQPLPEDQVSEKSMRHKITLWYAKQLTEDHPLLK